MKSFIANSRMVPPEMAPSCVWSTLPHHTASFCHCLLLCFSQLEMWECYQLLNLHILVLYVHVCTICGSAGMAMPCECAFIIIVYVYYMRVQVWPCQVKAYNVPREVRGQLLKTDYFLLPWDPGTKLGWSGLHSKLFYPLSHLTGLCLLILSAFIVRLQSFWNVGPMSALLHSTTV